VRPRWKQEAPQAVMTLRAARRRRAGGSSPATPEAACRRAHQPGPSAARYSSGHPDSAARPGRVHLLGVKLHGGSTRGSVPPTGLVSRLFRRHRWEWAWVTGEAIGPETPVRSLGVVMVHIVAKHALEMASSPDQHVIEALLANGPHPTFGKGVGLRRPVGRSHRPASLRAKDLVEGAAELGVSVMDEEEDIFESPVDGEVSGLLR